MRTISMTMATDLATEVDHRAVQGDGFQESPAVRSAIAGDHIHVQAVEAVGAVVANARSASGNLGITKHAGEAFVTPDRVAANLRRSAAIETVAEQLLRWPVLWEPKCPSKGKSARRVGLQFTCDPLE